MNTFGSAQLQFALYDPRGVLEERHRFGRSAIPALVRANSLCCPSGRWPTRGWLLMARGDYDRLDKYSTALQLHLGDTTKSDNVGVLQNLSIVQAQCVTRGLAADKNALYLVEITDDRGILQNKWFSFPTTSNYNIRAPAYPSTFHPSSMNSGTTWTWTTMLQNLWEQMTLLGTWPGLPFTPAGTPEGWWFPGVSAWTALCDVLDYLGMTVVCNLQSSTPFTIAKQNTADTAYAALLTKYQNRLEEDMEWIDTGAGRVPATVKVLFRRRNTIYGTEETVRYDSPQWDMDSIYSVSVSAPAAYSSAVGTHHLWSDFTVRYDQDGAPLAADVAMAATIAQERATQYYAHINPAAYTDRTYAGALPFKTGSLVDGVRWYQDLSDGMRWGGWRTQVVYGPQPPWPEYP